MSVRVQTYVWQLKLSPTQKLVAIALADHCHDDGSEARPSQNLLVTKTGLSKRTVGYTLQQLLDLDVIRLQRKSGQHQANCYTFDLPDYFATIRDAPVTTLAPEVQMTRQSSKPCTPESHVVLPNHKEPSSEPTANVVNISEAASKARWILKGKHDIEGRRER